MTLALAAVSASAQNVRIGVLGLFHPQQLALSTTEGVTLTLHADERAFVLDSSLGTGVARIRRSGDAVVVDVASEVIAATSLQIAGRGGTPGSFVLAVPGKISRRYFGTLEVKVASGNLLAIVATDLETAVASVAAAETTPDTPLEAMKAQAVAIRSYFVAGTGRHVNFDFCDTTHCQFLRAPPAPRQRATKAGRRREAWSWRMNLIPSQRCTPAVAAAAPVRPHKSGCPLFPILTIPWIASFVGKILRAGRIEFRRRRMCLYAHMTSQRVSH